MSDSQTELDRLQKSGNEHYGRKEYQIAIECYRAALENGMNGHSSLFNFGYSLAETGNHTEAAQVYQKSIAAGSRSGSAYNNLGWSLHKINKHQEARDAYSKATQIEPKNALYWRNLAGCLSHLKEHTAELSARQKLVACNGCTANDWNSLGCALDREKDNEGSLDAFRMAAYLCADACYFNNMALMHSRLGHALDAYHACRHALDLNTTYESALKEFPRFEGALKVLSQSLKLQAPREIGPHDYVNPYVLLDLTETDRKPESYEWFDQPTEWKELLGSLTRRRRSLKAELELNDGSIGWLPKLRITDEVVHRVLVDLDDDGWHSNHWAVFRMPMLKQFLMYGELDYFYSREYPPYPLLAEIAGADTTDWEHRDFIEFISPFFSRRLAIAVKQSIETANYQELIALFATRLPITSTYFDEALEPARRHFTNRRKILGAVETGLETASIKNIESELESAVDEANFLNILAVQHGEKLREDMIRAYRGISIALANHQKDYLTSELALKAAEHFKGSVTTKERLAGDRKTIEGLIQREKKKKKEEEETKERYTLKLDLKSWFRTRTLEITPTHFRWGDESILAERIKAIRFGITIKYTNGVKTGIDSILAVRGMHGNIIETTWLQEMSFSAAVQSVLGLYSSGILTDIVASIERGEMVSIGSLRVGRQGVEMATGVFTTKLRLIQWNNVVAQQSAGIVSISSKTDAKAKKTLSTCNDWNACMMTTIIEIMKSSSK
jgi:tetratricopeptide (TPR) repeat protein